jgi:ABC-2 type transport system permease protein
MYGLLLKTFLKDRLSIHRLFGQKIARSKFQSILMIGLLVYAFGVTAFSSIFLNYEIGLGLQQVDQLSQLLFNLYSQLASLGFLFGFFQAQGYLFQYKDFDLLGTLPISQKVIIAAKLTMMLVFVYLFAMIMVLPTYGVWWYLSSPSIWQIFLFLPMYLVTPIPMMLLGSFMSYWIRKLTQQFIRANVLQTIFSVLFIISFASFSYGFTQWVPPIILTWFESVDVFGGWLVDSITNFSVLPFLSFLSIHLLILFGFIWLMNQPLLKMNQQRTLAPKIEHKKIPLKTMSVSRHLLVKEWHRFIGTSIYFINTGFGLIMLLAATLVALFFPILVNAIIFTLSVNGIHPIWFIFAVIGFPLSIVYTPAVSLSLEGKNLAALKALPIPSLTIFKAKVGFNLWLTLPVVFLTTMVAITIFSLSWIESTLALVMLMLFATLLSIFFLYLNLFFPRFDYHHEVEVVKQSLAALLAVFGGLAWMGLFFWLAFVPFASLDASLQMTVLIGVEIVAIAIMSFILIRRSDYFYNQLTT